MNQAERLEYLIDALLQESPRYRRVQMPGKDRFDLLRALMNVRPPLPVSTEFLKVQDEYLKGVNAERGVTALADLIPVRGNLYLWQGDITTLKCDAIVNAANSQLLGCFRPLHSCIDNCIHTYAGVQLRLKCAELMEAQGQEEPTGSAKITPAYNLPSKYVLHTVGPIVDGTLTKEHCELLASCYRSCLDLAAENGCGSVAFCAISTGVFGFPKEPAAEIAVQTVEEWLKAHNSGMQVIFTAYSDRSLEIYRQVLDR